MSSLIKSGLVSISFRKLSPEEIVSMVAEAGLDGIEWGGDVHVPHGDLSTADRVRELTVAAGLAVASYGSYYRAGVSESEGLAFSDVLESALVLEAPLIRVWCGNKGSAQATPETWAEVTDDLCRIGEMAENKGIKIACEYHGGTLTDTSETTQRLFSMLEGRNVFPYWQPVTGLSQDACEESLKVLLPILTNVHAFHWIDRDGKRLRESLAAGKAPWKAYVELLRQTGREHWVMLEFVRDDSEAQFMDDAATLRCLVAQCPVK